MFIPVITGVYSSETTSSVYRGSQNSAYGSYAQQQQQPSAKYQVYNNKMNPEAQNSSVSSPSLGLQGSVAYIVILLYLLYC